MTFTLDDIKRLREAPVRINKIGVDELWGYQYVDISLERSKFNCLLDLVEEALKFKEVVRRLADIKRLSHTI